MGRVLPSSESPRSTIMIIGSHYAVGGRLRSNIIGILGWIGRESERKEILVGKPTKLFR